MEFVLSFLRRLGVGFIYGVGFTIGGTVVVAVLGLAGATWWATKTGGSVSATAPIDRDSQTRPETFVITDTSVVRNSWGGLSFLGTIENKGDATNHYVNVYSDLFDKGGKFIYQCKTQFNEGLRKAEKANFMIECHSMPKELVGGYDSFKVYARAY